MQGACTTQAESLSVRSVSHKEHGPGGRGMADSFLRDGTATLRSRRLWVLPGTLPGGGRGAVRVLGFGFPEAPPDSLALAIPNTARIRSFS